MSQMQRTPINLRVWSYYMAVVIDPDYQGLLCYTTDVTKSMSRMQEILQGCLLVLPYPVIKSMENYIDPQYRLGY